jgi:hypothetical protein
MIRSLLYIIAAIAASVIGEPIKIIPGKRNTKQLNLNSGERIVGFIDGLWLEGYMALNLEV